MQNKSTFEYAIIRIVPKVEREEFFNVGVILYAKDMKFLAMKTHIDAKKLLAFSEDIDLKKMEGYLSAWNDVCTGDPLGGAIGKLDLPSRFRWLTACRSTIIQSSKPHPGLTHNPAVALDALFDEFVRS